MIIAIDGGCKWQGTPNCLSVGVAVPFMNGTYDEPVFSIELENSSSQRGEIQGLISALEYYHKNKVYDTDELGTLMIVTDSEYVLKTISFGWLEKWKANNWTNTTGVVSNVDLWEKVWHLIYTQTETTDITMQYVKGHLYKYSPAIFKRAMDDEGLQYAADNLMSMISRPLEAEQVLKKVKDEIESRGHSVFNDTENLRRILLGNVLADCLAGYAIDKLLKSGAIN